GDIYIEKKARQKEYKSRDNHQKIPDDYICPGYDCDEIKTQIDVDSLKKYLQEEKKLTNLLTSEDAGLYLCEYTYYISLCENEKKDDKKKVLFVHVPKKNDSFPYSVDEVAKILEDIGEW
ncbi:6023_t:CDS:1, partial [Scutellospora calospora]